MVGARWMPKTNPKGNVMKKAKHHVVDPVLERASDKKRFGASFSRGMSRDEIRNNNQRLQAEVRAKMGLNDSKKVLSFG